MDVSTLTDGAEAAARAPHPRASRRAADPGHRTAAASPARCLRRAAAEAVAPDRADSELSALNRCAEREDVDTVLGPVLGEVLDAALRAARLTSGLVDPTAGAPGRRSRAGLPPRPAPGIGAVDYDPRTRRVRLARGTVLDLTAAADAWAADRAAAVFAAAHPGRAAVHRVGGTLAVTGSAADAAALLAEEPAGDAPVPGGWAQLVSGGRRGVAVVDGREDVVLNPVTGTAASPWRRVVVVADDAVAAQAYARAAQLLGPQAPSWVAACGAVGVFDGLRADDAPRDRTRDRP